MHLLMHGCPGAGGTDGDAEAECITPDHVLLGRFWKELVGDFKNAGREWQPKKQPEQVSSHDFQGKTLGKATPYGVYDIGQNQGWVSVGMNHDTAQFAVQSIAARGSLMGHTTYPNGKELLIIADAGSSNGYQATTVEG